MIMSTHTMRQQSRNGTRHATVRPSQTTPRTTMAATVRSRDRTKEISTGLHSLDKTLVTRGRILDRHRLRATNIKTHRSPTKEIIDLTRNRLRARPDGMRRLYLILLALFSLAGVRCAARDYYDEMVYDEEIRCVRIVRRRLPDVSDILAGDERKTVCTTSTWIEEDQIKEARVLVQKMKKQSGMHQMDTEIRKHLITLGYSSEVITRALMDFHAEYRKHGSKPSIKYEVGDIVYSLENCKNMGREKKVQIPKGSKGTVTRAPHKKSHIFVNFRGSHGAPFSEVKVLKNSVTRGESEKEKIGKAKRRTYLQEKDQGKEEEAERNRKEKLSEKRSEHVPVKVNWGEIHDGYLGM